MVISACNLPYLPMSKLQKIGMHKISRVFVFGHFDIVLHFGMVDLSSDCIDFRISELLIIFFLLFRNLNFLLRLQEGLRPQEIHITLQNHLQLCFAFCQIVGERGRNQIIVIDFGEEGLRLA